MFDLVAREPIPADEFKPQFEALCRVRPLLKGEQAEEITIDLEKPSITISTHVRNDSKEFIFNKIYSEQVSQSTLCQELAESILGQFKCHDRGTLLLGYGVTKSGKTYTILGNQKEPGLLPTLVDLIETTYPGEIIEISAMELYNNQFYSLQTGQKLFPKEMWCTYQFDEYLPDQVSSDNSAKCIKNYIKNRIQLETHANMASSRSHAIFKIKVPNVNLSIAIVDLAGSQRLNKANTNLQETTFINRSLFGLGRCIQAFRDGSATIPFRETKLTKCLAEYLNGSAYKIVIMAHINRSGQMYHENINVLEYASMSMNIKKSSAEAHMSIARSLRKPKTVKSKSPHMTKDVTSLNNSRCNTPTRGKEKEDPLIKKARQENHKTKQIFYQKYINQLVGRNQEFDFYLDVQFARQAEEDRLFIESLYADKYVPPEQEKKRETQRCKAKARQSMRNQILEFVQIEKHLQMADYGSEMGPSMRKCVEASIRKEKQLSAKKENQKEQVESGTQMGPSMRKFFKRYLEENYEDSSEKTVNNRVQTVDFSTSIGLSMQKHQKKEEQKPILYDFGTRIGQSLHKKTDKQAEFNRYSFKKQKNQEKKENIGQNQKKQVQHPVKQARQVEKQESNPVLVTPSKKQEDLDHSQDSFLKRAITNPMILLKSGYKIMNNIQEGTRNMFQTFRQMMKELPSNRNRFVDLTERINGMRIVRQESIDFHLRVPGRQQEQPMEVLPEGYDAPQRRNEEPLEIMSPSKQAQNLPEQPKPFETGQSIFPKNNQEYQGIRNIFGSSSQYQRNSERKVNQDNIFGSSKKNERHSLTQNIFQVQRESEHKKQRKIEQNQQLDSQSKRKNQEQVIEDNQKQAIETNNLQQENNFEQSNLEQINPVEVQHNPQDFIVSHEQHISEENQNDHRASNESSHISPKFKEIEESVNQSEQYQVQQNLIEKVSRISINQENQEDQEINKIQAEESVSLAPHQEMLPLSIKSEIQSYSALAHKSKKSKKSKSKPKRVNRFEASTLTQPTVSSANKFKATSKPKSQKHSNEMRFVKSIDKQDVSHIKTRHQRKELEDKRK